jgi:hypothetical protein
MIAAQSTSSPTTGLSASIIVTMAGASQRGVLDTIGAAAAAAGNGVAVGNGVGGAAVGAGWAVGTGVKSGAGATLGTDSCSVLYQI